MGVKHAELKPGRNPVKDRLRLPEETPTYPLTQRIRQEALLILHEGQFSAADIAEMIGEDTSHVTKSPARSLRRWLHRIRRPPWKRKLQESSLPGHCPTLYEP